MNIGDPIEEQCVWMWRQVFGNVEHSIEDARRAFWMQNPAVIDGWERLARNVTKVTTMATFRHVDAVLDEQGRWKHHLGETIQAVR